VKQWSLGPALSQPEPADVRPSRGGITAASSAGHKSQHQVQQHLIQQHPVASADADKQRFPSAARKSAAGGDPTDQLHTSDGVAPIAFTTSNAWLSEAKASENDSAALGPPKTEEELRSAVSAGASAVFGDVNGQEPESCRVPPPAEPEKEKAPAVVSSPANSWATKLFATPSDSSMSSKGTGTKKNI
jgi:hypothetical protein